MEKQVFSAQNWVPYSSHITPKIIKVKGGSYLMTFKLSGVSYIGIPQEIIDSRVRQINRFIAQLRSPFRFNMYLHMHCVKRPIKVGLPDDFLPFSFAEELDKNYENSIKAYPV